MPSTRITRPGATYTPLASALGREVEEFRNRARNFFEEPLSRWMREPMLPAVSRVVDWYPAAEVGETTKEFTVTMELAGMKPKDVNVEFTDGMLTIRGEKTAEKEEKDDDTRFHVWERSYGSFIRSFEFPMNVDAEKIAADFADGVLRILLPKQEAVKPNARKITIAEKTT